MLHREENWAYLLTCRLTQDALERWFGMARGACGGNDHPNPQTFLQIFRLLCSYSLVKPPKGCNVEGKDLLRTLMGTAESITSFEENRKDRLKKIDRILDGACPIDAVATEDPNCSASLASSRSSLKNPKEDHSYDITRTSDEVQVYVAGYVTRKMLRWLKCNECINSLRSHDLESSDPRNVLIEKLERYGGLLRPSIDLFNLTKVIECSVLDVVGKHGVNLNTLSLILDQLSGVKDLPMVGCEEHKKEAAKKVLNFYIIMRAHFLSKSYNTNNSAGRERARAHRKRAKLA